MIEEMKNKNEYRENGNIYVKKIKSCTCKSKIDDMYIIVCKIHQRGEYYYRFCDTEQWISRIGKQTQLWLSEEAEQTVRREVDLFKELEKRFQSEECREIRMDDAKLSVFYESFENDCFDCMIKHFSMHIGRTITEFYLKTSIGKILHDLRFYSNFHYSLPDCESKELLQNPTKENIMKNPFIIAAQKDGDVKTEIKIKICYGLADNNDCKQLSEILNLPILPSLPEEYNKEYFIDSDTLTSESFMLLKNSGFKIIHRPNFAMRGSTRTRITLNPHTKTCVDAAKKDTESMSLDDFLKIYDNPERDCK